MSIFAKSGKISRGGLEKTAFLMPFQTVSGWGFKEKKRAPAKTLNVKIRQKWQKQSGWADLLREVIVFLDLTEAKDTKVFQQELLMSNSAKSGKISRAGLEKTAFLVLFQKVSGWDPKEKNFASAVSLIVKIWKKWQKLSGWAYLPGKV